MKTISVHSIQRLIIYRKLLREFAKNGNQNIFSHKLAALSGNNPTQVRRDIMAIGYQGSPVRGYNINDLEKSISNFLSNPNANKVVLVGLGHLGRAIINYCDGLNSTIEIIATFDKKEEIIGRVIHGTHCYHVSELEKFIKENKIKVGIITVPLEHAQEITDQMINSGIISILNFTHAKLKVPVNIFVENIDMMVSLEKAAYFAKEKK